MVSSDDFAFILAGSLTGQPTQGPVYTHSVRQEFDVVAAPWLALQSFADMDLIQTLHQLRHLARSGRLSLINPASPGSQRLLRLLQINTSDFRLVLSALVSTTPYPTRLLTAYPWYDPAQTWQRNLTTTTHRLLQNRGAHGLSIYDTQTYLTTTTNTRFIFRTHLHRMFVTTEFLRVVNPFIWTPPAHTDETPPDRYEFLPHDHILRHWRVRPAQHDTDSLECFKPPNIGTADQPEALVGVVLREDQRQSLQFMLQTERSRWGVEDQMLLHLTGDVWVCPWHIHHCTTMEPQHHIKGGILADAVGFGKTITTLALIAANPRPPEQATSLGGVLVVCPPNILHQWSDEIRNRLPSARVHRHHGPKRAIDREALLQHDVVLTTPGVLRSETQDGLIPQTKWWRVIYDEAHITTHLLDGFTLHADRRWCVSATPFSHMDDLLWALQVRNPPRRSVIQSFRATIQPFLAQITVAHLKHELPHVFNYQEVTRLIRSPLDPAVEADFTSWYNDNCTRHTHSALDVRNNIKQFRHQLALRKVDVVCSNLLAEHTDQPTKKFIAFSESWDVLTNLQHALTTVGIQSHPYSGDILKRNRVLNQFRTDPAAVVLLTPIRSACVGLNIACASGMIFMEPPENRVMLTQAIGRLARCTQTNDIEITVQVSHPLEERMWGMIQEGAHGSIYA